MKGTCPQCGYKAPPGLGQRQHGERNPAAKLTAREVLWIFNSGKSTRDLADKFGVGVEAVQRIKNGRKWSSITGATYVPRKRN